MNTQMNVRLPPNLLSKATTYAQKHGFGTVQELIKDALRERVVEDTELTHDEWRVVKALLRSAKDKRQWRTEDELFRRLRRGQ